MAVELCSSLPCSLDTDAGAEQAEVGQVWFKGEPKFERSFLGDPVGAAIVEVDGMEERS